FLDESAGEGAIRVDLAWQLFFETKTSIPQGHGGRLIPFTNWIWDELGKKAGHLNRNARGDLTLAIPALDQAALDFLVRIASFWASEVYLRKAGKLSENLWRKPIVNVFDDADLDASERALLAKDGDSSDRFFMPLLGPGRAFFRVETIQNGESAARYHSHSAVDEYYLILQGSGTLRYNDKETLVKPGDLIGKPTGPDAASQLIADRGELLRILDMEVWHDRAYFSKDVVWNPDFGEILLRGPGLRVLFPAEALLAGDDFQKHYDEGYRRNKDGSWVPSKNRGHKKVREKT
ncbi:cupin domain-containing protein, partial [Candidatus Bathyarchaeota archaeon]|nr:cupin domain-containing protein [Candidatus Bathyarchaeota archaeon]